jgi:two-component system chemotaxis sensor kinase CheA
VEIDLDTILKTFQAEAEEGFARTESALVALETQPEDRGLVDAVLRDVHTLKGNAFSLGFAPLSEFAHALEDLLERLRSRELSVTTPLVSLMLAALDALRELLPDAIAGNDELRPAQARVLETLRRAQSEPSATLVEAARLPAGGRAEAPVRRGDEAGARAQTLRVDVEKLDAMLNLSGEIAVRLRSLRGLIERVRGAGREELLEVHDETERLHRALQEHVTKARMVPVGPTFHSFVRAVRDGAASLGKRARLVVEGEDVEVDTRVIEQLRDALTHMIRNALDHGIEPSDARAAAGKDPCGHIALRALRDAGQMVIEVEDDGAGIDRGAIASRARELGISAEPELLPPDDLLRLIFEPGFSTQARASAFSGRGVGLDVVLRNVESLHGAIRLESREGRGTRFTLRLPLTLAIIEGFGVGAAGETFVVPLDRVIECVELPSVQRERADQGLFDLRGRALPYARLSSLLGLAPRERRRESVVVVRHEQGLAGIVVDELHGEAQTVIKPLGPLFESAEGVAGSTILASGRVALILDVPGLLGRIAGGAQSSAASRSMT